MKSETFSISGLVAALAATAIGVPQHHFGRTRYAAGWKGVRGGRYLPHQGKRECARRTRQAARAWQKQI
jgi:hypothetical protein